MYYLIKISHNTINIIVIGYSIDNRNVFNFRQGHIVEIVTGNNHHGIFKEREYFIIFDRCILDRDVSLESLKERIYINLL